MNNEFNKPAELVNSNDPFAEVNAMVDPFNKDKPESVCFHFFFFILKTQCDEAWNLLSKYTKQKFLDIVYEGIKETDEFYMQDEITNKEDLRKAFESNNPDLKESFWQQFSEDVKLEFLVEYAEFRPKLVKGEKAQVDAVFKLTDGSETKAPFNMVYEDSCWRMAFMESLD